MSDPTGATIGSLYVPGFKANLNLLPQQTTSRILPHIDFDLAYPKDGQFFNADDVGYSDPTDVTVRVPATPDGFVDMYRRFGTFRPFSDAKWLDNEDMARMLEDPTNQVMQSMMAGLARKRDLAIISAAFGTYMYQDQNQNYQVGPVLAQKILNTDATAHAQENLVAKPSGGYGLTIGKLTDAKSLLDNSEIDEPAFGDKPSDYFFVCTARQLQDLLLTVPVTSNFYNQVQSLVAGTLDYFMGFNFIRLPVNKFYYPLPKVNYTRQCFAFHRKAICYRGRPIINTRVAQRADFSYRWQAFYEVDHAAVRRYDNGVVEVDCDESTNIPWNNT